MRFATAAVAAWLTVGVVYWNTARPGHDWGGDFAVYVWQAQNMRQGRPWTASSYVVTEASARNHPAVYPPLTAWMLRPVIDAWPDYQALKRYLAFWLWLALPAWWMVGRRMGLRAGDAAVVVLLFALSGLVSQVRDSVGSEGVHLFFSGLALWLALELDTCAPTGVRRWIAAAFLAVFLVLVYAARAVGLALIVGVYGAWLWRGTLFRQGWRLAAAGLTAAALAAYGRWVYDAGGQYGNQFTANPVVAVKALSFYVRSHAALWPGSPAMPRYVATVAIAALAAWELWRRRKRLTAAEMYPLVMLGILSAYFVSANERYMVSVFPVLLFLAAAGLREWSGRLRLPWVPRASAALVLGLLVPVWWRMESGSIQRGVGQESFQRTVAYLRAGPPDAVWSWNPRLLALYTGRASLLPDLRQAAAEHGAVDLVEYLGGDAAPLTRPLLQGGQGWRLVRDEGDFRVWRREARR